MKTFLAALVAASFLAAPLVASATDAPAAQAETKVVIPVSGMHCGSCADNVDKAVRAVAGVKSSETSLDTSATTVVYDAKQVKVDALVAAIQKAGYKPGAPKN